MSRPAHQAGRRLSVTVLIVLMLIGAFYLIMYWSKQRELETLRRAEKSTVLRAIATAEAAQVSIGGAPHYLDISGVASDGSIASFFPPRHPAREFVTWDTSSCPTDASARACESFRRLGVRFGYPVWNRYGGTSGSGMASAREIAVKLGVPEPPPGLNDQPWFVLVAVDGEESKQDRHVYTSWDNTVHVGRSGPPR